MAMLGCGLTSKLPEKKFKFFLKKPANISHYLLLLYRLPGPVQSLKQASCNRGMYCTYIQVIKARGRKVFAIEIGHFNMRNRGSL